jgi:hypothetical protein
MAIALESHLHTGAYSELAVDLTVCTRPLLDLGDEPLVRRILGALGASHLIVDGVVEPASLGSELFVWLAAAYNEVLTASNLHELVTVARKAIEAAEPS